MAKHIELYNPLSINEMNIIFLANDVIFERADLYRDFTLTLNYLIINTYLGDDFTDDTQKINHFNWCWDKTCNLMNYGQINFVNNSEIYKQFMAFYFDLFYLVEEKPSQQIRINNLDRMWGFIFNPNMQKSKADLKTFISLYSIFEKSHNF